ncbi:MAG: nucleoside-diphosphate kinase [Candidatus Vogelbacteria bacterium]|nr:nucleoside-diphosphate kinase [Candidatus Vogelbacteria bacterium]
MFNTKEEKTFVMVKPDGVRKGLIGEIIKRFEQRDLKVVAMDMFQPTYEQIDGHYPKDEAWIARLGTKTLANLEKYGIDPQAEYGTDDNLQIGQNIRQWLVEYMTSAPLVKMVIEGTHAIDMVRKIVGPSSPYLAELGTIRGDFSVDSPLIANREHRVMMNLVHASENQQEAEHEIKHWFGNDTIFQYKRF